MAPACVPSSPTAAAPRCTVSSHRGRPPRSATRHGARHRGGAGRAAPVGGRRAVRARARGRQVSARSRARVGDVPAARAPAGAVRPRPERQRRPLGRPKRERLRAEPRAPSSRPGRRGRASGRGGEPLAAQRRCRDICHAGGEVLGPTGRLHGGGEQARARRSIRCWRASVSSASWSRKRSASPRSSRRARPRSRPSAPSRHAPEQIGELARAVQARLAECLAGDKDVERAGQEHARVQRPWRRSRPSRDRWPKRPRRRARPWRSSASGSRSRAMPRRARGGGGSRAGRDRERAVRRDGARRRAHGVPGRSRLCDRAGRSARSRDLARRRDRA